MAPKWKHRELQEQEKKRIEEQSKKPVKKSLTPLRALRILALPTALLVLSALTSRASQASLAPIYGAIPASVNHVEGITATVLIGCLWRYYFNGFNGRRDLMPYLAMWALWLPAAEHAVVKYSGKLGPVWGVIAMTFLSCHSVVIPSAFVAAEVLEAFNLQDMLGPVMGAGVPALAMDLLFFRPVEHFAGQILPNLRIDSAWFSPVSLRLVIAAGYALISPVKPYWMLTLAIPGIMYNFLANPHFEGKITTNRLNEALQIHNWTLVNRQWSNTGYLSILESTEAQYRVMRCDHSLLGGEWLLTSERRTQGWKVNEPIYVVFEMLEAVRLIEQETPIYDFDASALVVGLGIGTAPKALMAHGINTTIVELDPVVHQFATKYFDLPREHTAVLEDAVSWVDTQATKAQQTYDYIIHDVFTGGAEPLPLFTNTFLSNLRSLLKPNGLVAINYAGELEEDLTARTLNTIDQAFDGQCKIYRDQPPVAPTGNQTSSVDFLNMVVFCRNSPGPIAFRKPTAADFLGSKSREHHLLPDPDLEIEFPLRQSGNSTTQILKRGDEGEWATQQAASAVKHWHIMRDVLPAAVWELW